LQPIENKLKTTVIRNPWIFEVEYFNIRYIFSNFDGLAKSQITNRGSYKAFPYCEQDIFHKYTAKVQQNAL